MQKILWGILATIKMQPGEKNNNISSFQGHSQKIILVKGLFMNKREM